MNMAQFIDKNWREREREIRRDCNMCTCTGGGGGGADRKKVRSVRQTKRQTELETHLDIATSKQEGIDQGLTAFEASRQTDVQRNRQDYRIKA